MKSYTTILKKFALLCVVFGCSMNVGNALDISVDLGSFFNGEKSYGEVYLRISGNSLKMRSSKKSDRQQASVEVTILVNQGEQIITYDKFTLRTSFRDEITDLIDIKRFALEKGSYSIRVQAVDSNDPDNTIDLEKFLTIDDYTSEVSMSDVILFSSVKEAKKELPSTKNGLIMEPLSFMNATEDVDQLYIYTETYRAASIDALTFIKYSIISGFEQYNGTDEVMKKVKKVDGKSLEPHLLTLPVDELLSGKYHVKVELINKEKNVLAFRTADFVKQNKTYDFKHYKEYDKEDTKTFVGVMDEDSLNYVLRATTPLILEPKKSMVDYIIDKGTVNSKKKFLYDLWKEKTPVNTPENFSKYMEVADNVEKEFNSNVGLGFETDRGYTYLKYGKPNNIISIDTEVDAFPYEIWYYSFVPFTNQTNVRFLFYNRSLVHNDYSLLHSTCRGERQSPNWEVQLYAKGLEVPDQNPIDATSVQDSWNRNAKRYFNDF